LTSAYPITVVVADDHAVVRGGIRAVLERAGEEFKVVAEAADVPSTLEALRAHRPNLLVLDVSMPGGSTLACLEDFWSVHGELAIAVLTMHSDPEYARAAIRAGVRSFVLKQAEPDELLRAFRTAVEGGTYVDPRMGAGLASEPDDATTALSSRERQIVREISLGYTNAEIAERLFLSERTVKTYRARAIGKLGVSSRAELIQYARQSGLID
jgi:two-component system response regulator NreC